MNFEWRYKITDIISFKLNEHRFLCWQGRRWGLVLPAVGRWRRVGWFSGEQGDEVMNNQSCRACLWELPDALNVSPLAVWIPRRWVIWVAAMFCRNTQIHTHTQKYEYKKEHNMCAENQDIMLLDCCSCHLYTLWSVLPVGVKLHPIALQFFCLTLRPEVQDDAAVSHDRETGVFLNQAIMLQSRTTQK